VVGRLERADAVRMLAMGERFGYYRGSPSLSWERAGELAERSAPGALPPLVEEYAGRPIGDLADEAMSLAHRALR
jgi:hypothetical protein